jgi:HAD superfamily hydrolase (TIGR01509 family)
MVRSANREIGFIFDWDGVVVDSSSQHEESWERLAAEEGLPLFEGHFKLGFGKRNQLIIPDILKWSNVPSEIERLGDQKEVHYRDIIRETGIEPLPGVRKFVEFLIREGLPFAVGSSTPRENIEAVMSGAGIEGLFNKIVAAADVSRGKPDPEVFLKAAGLIQVPPNRCVVFEDSVSGVEAGLAGGMTVIGLTTTNNREVMQQCGASLVKDSFEEISLAEVLELVDSK